MPRILNKLYKSKEQKKKKGIRSNINVVSNSNHFGKKTRRRNISEPKTAKSIREEALRVTQKAKNAAYRKMYNRFIKEKQNIINAKKRQEIDEEFSKYYEQKLKEKDAERQRTLIGQPSKYIVQNPMSNTELDEAISNIFNTQQKKIKQPSKYIVQNPMSNAELDEAVGNIFNSMEFNNNNNPSLWGRRNKKRNGTKKGKKNSSKKGKKNTSRKGRKK